MLKKISYTSRFKKDLKKIDQKISKTLKSVSESLVKGEQLDSKFEDHLLVGNYKGHRECHLEYNMLLIYKVDEESVTLTRIGNHSNLFE